MRGSTLRVEREAQCIRDRETPQGTKSLPLGAATHAGSPHPFVAWSSASGRRATRIRAARSQRWCTIGMPGTGLFTLTT